MVHSQVDLAIIGGGTTGLTAAQVALNLGVRVALVEQARTGGDCTWTGCVPSKALIAAARQAHQARTAARFGVHTHGVEVEFPAVMDFVHQTIHEIYAEETPDVLRAQGIEVYEATARFTDPHTLLLDERDSLHARHVLIATGARALVPPSLREVPVLTNHTLFDLRDLPEHLLIVGGGPIGTEMAQAFRRLGARVTLLERETTLLPRDDPEAAAAIMQVLRDEGVDLRTGVIAVGATGTRGDITLHLNDGSVVQGSHLLVAAGRTPNLEALNLDAAGVQTQGGRLLLDDRLRTTQKHIYAAGDVTGGPQFTHVAGWQAAQVVRNMFLPLSARATLAVVPWATFTDPEVAQVGLTEAQARARYADAQVTRLPMTRADRAMTEGQSHGFMKIVHRASGKLLGATIVGHNAGEMLNPWVRVAQKGGRVWDVALAMNVYPTLGTGSVILATQQVAQQMQHGLLGRVLRGLARRAG